jgi:glycine/D-amino acid oxidase-like deaminating enzyme
MDVDALVVGQGLAGTMVSWFLEKEGASYFVVDNEQPNSASRVAAGIINPVTGRRHVETWMIDELMHFARNTYDEIRLLLNTELVTETRLVDFFTTPQMRQSFADRVSEGSRYLSFPADERSLLSLFSYDFGVGTISPVFKINVSQLIDGWRQWLIANRKYQVETLDVSLLIDEGGSFSYKDWQFRKLILCNGVSHLGSKWFANLPFAYNKGQALIIETDSELPDYVFKKGMMVTAIGKNQYWVGSSYEWDFTDAEPSALFAETTHSLLRQLLKVNFRVTGHQAALRPATIERRPFVGTHPADHRIAILNGLGTKGCSLAPFFANELVQHLYHEKALTPEVDVRRFERLLRR